MRAGAYSEICCMHNIILMLHNKHTASLLLNKLTTQAPHIRVTLHFWELRRGATKERTKRIELKDQFEDYNNLSYQIEMSIDQYESSEVPVKSQLEQNWCIVFHFYIPLIKVTAADKWLKTESVFFCHYIGPMNKSKIKNL